MSLLLSTKKKIGASLADLRGAHVSLPSALNQSSEENLRALLIGGGDLFK